MGPTNEAPGLPRPGGPLEYARSDCLAYGRWDQVNECDQAIAEVEAMMTASGLRGAIPSATQPDAAKEEPRRRRSTRRRQDVPDLPAARSPLTSVGRVRRRTEGWNVQ